MEINDQEPEKIPGQERENKSKKLDRPPVSGIIPDSEIEGSDADTNPDTSVVVPGQERPSPNGKKN